MANAQDTSDANRAAVGLAMAACLMMISYHVGSKAVRDALFLQNFPLNKLPYMVIAAALVSIVAVLAASRAMRSIEPAKLVPISFFVSGAMQLILFFLVEQFPRTCAVVLYAQTAAMGALLTSGFWSMVNERFDPRTMKTLVGRIAGAGTVGGMVGGVITERLAAYASLAAVIPALAGYHLVCGFLLLRMSRGCEAPARKPADESSESGGWAILQRAPYLRTLGTIVILGTMSAAMLDYVFKAQALAEYGKGAGLLRYFALFYSVSGTLTFLVQTGLSGLALSRLGTAKTIATLPFAVGLGGMSALLVPGLAVATGARMLETVFRGSLFRASYEQFYTPMPIDEKRATKSMVDVGFDRMGDAVGNVIISYYLLLENAIAFKAMLITAVGIGAASVVIARKLQGAYVGALERGLHDRRQTQENEDSSSGSVDMPTQMSGIAAYHAIEEQTTWGTANTEDIVVREIGALRSGNPSEIRQVLVSAHPVKPYLVPHLIPLLGVDRVYRDVAASLRAVAERNCGQLLDALLDPATEFQVRRRLPRVLSHAPTTAVANGLLRALNDNKFEVRYRCGNALQSMKKKNPLLGLTEESVFSAIRKEVAVSKPVWDSHRSLEQGEDTTEQPMMDEFVRERTSRSVEHVFTLLALVLPAEPLKIAYQGLQSGDSHLRGTALEYLDSILPRDIKLMIWPLMERSKRDVKPMDARTREEVLAELMRSRDSAISRIEDLKKPPA